MRAKAWILVLLALAAIAFWASGALSPRAPDPEPEPAHGTGGGGTGVLVVTALLPAGAEGRVAFALYDTAAAFAGQAEPLEREFVAGDAGGLATWRVTALPHGRYAVKAYLDANGNGELDKGAFGIPSEPYGFSRNARGRLGPPKYEDVAFTLDAPELVLEIRLAK